MRTWTSEQDEAIRTLYAGLATARFTRDLWAAAAKALPGLTEPIIYKRARALGLCAQSYWTPGEIAYLRINYARHEDHVILQRLQGRKWGAIQTMARRLGLTGRWDGYVSVEEGARMAGLRPDDLRHILSEAGVPGTPRSSRGSRTGRTWMMYVWEDVRAAVVRHLALETVREASERLGVPVSTVRRWLRAEGYSLMPGGKLLRWPPTKYDYILAERLEAWKAVKGRP